MLKALWFPGEDTIIQIIQTVNALSSEVAYKQRNIFTSSHERFITIILIL